MRIGINFGGDPGAAEASIDDMVGSARAAEAKGFSTFWTPHIFSFDALGALTVVGRETKRIRVGTAVIPTYPRHPTALAQQALTAAAATGNRFTLGIGLSHKILIEDMLGFSFERPARHMREYLSVLMPALRGEPVHFDGEHYCVHGLQLAVPGSAPVPTLVAALGPAMLKVAGELADGTVTWMVGPRTMERHIVARLLSAAEAADRPAPQVVACVPIVVTHAPDDARERINRELFIYGQLPSYRAMLDREGATGPADIAVVGDENTVRRQLDQYRDAGVTELGAVVMEVEPGPRQRTIDFLAAMPLR